MEALRLLRLVVFRLLFRVALLLLAAPRRVLRLRRLLVFLAVLALRRRRRFVARARDLRRLTVERLLRDPALRRSLRPCRAATTAGSAAARAATIPARRLLPTRRKAEALLLLLDRLLLLARAIVWRHQSTVNLCSVVVQVSQV